MIHAAVDRGLGRHRSSLSPSEFDQYSKVGCTRSDCSFFFSPVELTRLQFNYTSQILTIIIVCLAKLSMTMLITAITPSRAIFNACRLSNVVVVAWAGASIIALAFQCRVPRPWDFTPGRCINQV